MADPRTRSAFRLTVILLVAGSLSLLVGFAMTWAHATVPLAAGVDAATRQQEVTGREIFPGPAVAGWVTAAGIAGILATRSWGRAVVGLLVSLAGIVAVVAAGAFAAMPGSYVDDALSRELGAAVAVPSSATGWWALALTGGVLVLYGGLWTVIAGRRWPSLGSRYERRPRQAAATSSWDVLDSGQDPTDDLVE